MENQGDDKVVFSCVQQKVSEYDNIMLTQPFAGIEYKEAIFSMHPDKSPSPDGLNPAFFQHFWGNLGGDIFFLLLLLG